jgi:hypothetical protein
MVTLPLQNATPTAVPVQTLTLAAGNNTIIAPAGCVNGIWVIPPAGSANAKIFKGASGDTGIGGGGGGNNNPASWAFFPVAAGGTLIINSAGVEVVTLVYD